MLGVLEDAPDAASQFFRCPPARVGSKPARNSSVGLNGARNRVQQPGESKTKGGFTRAVGSSDHRGAAEGKVQCAGFANRGVGVPANAQLCCLESRLCIPNPRQRFNRNIDAGHPHAHVSQTLPIVFQDVVRRTVGNDAPLSGAENHKPIHHVTPRVHAMFHHNQRGARLRRDLGDGIADVLYTSRVKVRRGFIKHDHLRPHGDHAGEGQALLLPTGEVFRGVIERQRQSHHVQSATRAMPHFLTRNPQVLAAKHHVVADAGTDHLRIGVLQHQPHHAADAAGGVAVDKHLPSLFPFIITENPGDGGEQR